ANVSTEVETYSTIIDGKYATVTTLMKRPDRYLERINIPQDNVTNSIGFIGSSVWVQDPDGTVHSADFGSSNLGLSVVSTLYSPEMWNGFTKEPSRAYKSTSCYDLRMELQSGIPVDLLVSKATFIPVAAQVTLGGHTISVEYRDIDRSPGGELFPRHIDIIAPDGTTLFVYTITSLDANVPLDDSEFEPPA
ncbi:MAG TPA: hypothetical protein VEJ20_01475, partial [Candidatus Eremiobacteraceae bacterium]|nr:hypothetical protein [Candidatus Eremiobacteraceae bacterium]